MKTNKLPTALTDEELLEGLNSTEEIQKENNTVVSFLVFYNISPGLHPVQTRLLFDLYRKWTKDHVRAAQFFFEAGKYLSTKLVQGKQHYFINLNALEIGNKTFELLTATKHISKSPGYNIHIKNFYKDIQLKDGNNWTSSKILYQEYLKWRKTKTRVTRVSKISFNKFLKVHFKKNKLIDGILYISTNIKYEIK